MSDGDIPFRREMAFAYGEPAQVTPLVRRIVARNPSPFTLYGTNTYIVGRGRVAVIDPGPALAEHVDAVAAAVAGETVTHILVSHTHRDHSPAAVALKARCGGIVAAAAPAGRPADAAADPLSEAVEYDFAPDLVLADGDTVAGEGWTLAAVHTPGHMSNHLCFALAEERSLFSADHVMGWNTTVVSPPHGDMGDYLRSLQRCIERDDETYWPGHGPEIARPRPFVRAYLAHRRMREEEILACLGRGIDTVPAMVARMYAAVPDAVRPAAARSVLAHLVHLVETGRAACEGTPAADARYRLP